MITACMLFLHNAIRSLGLEMSFWLICNGLNQHNLYIYDKEKGKTSNAVPSRGILACEECDQQMKCVSREESFYYLIVNVLGGLHQYLTGLLLDVKMRKAYIMLYCFQDNYMRKFLMQDIHLKLHLHSGDIRTCSVDFYLEIMYQILKNCD